MASKTRICKTIDDTDRVRCSSGSIGILREEVWTGEDGSVVKYNLAFIHHEICRVDHGRVLGYDNAHGYHERHWMGEAQEFEFIDYPITLDRFLAEVAEIRRNT